MGVGHKGWGMRYMGALQGGGEGRYESGEWGDMSEEARGIGGDIKWEM